MHKCLAPAGESMRTSKILHPLFYRFPLTYRLPSRNIQSPASEQHLADVLVQPSNTAAS